MRQKLQDLLYWLGDLVGPKTNAELDRMCDQLMTPEQVIGQTEIATYSFSDGMRALLVTQCGTGTDMIGPMEGACEGILKRTK